MYDDRVKTSQRIYVEEEDEDEVVEPSTIRWTSIIFLPFHPVFELVTLVVVITKVILGPLNSVYPHLFCSVKAVTATYPLQAQVRMFYVYYCDIHYLVDIFLHVVHRQVTEEAAKREHLPKPLLFLIMDVFGVVPIIALVTTEECPERQLWPNILGFNECLIIYRVVQYFSLTSTHSVLKIVVGYFIIMVQITNTIACMYMLFTYHGLCQACSYETVYDWRLYLMDRMALQSENDLIMFVPLASLIVGYLMHNLVVIMTPNTYSELALSNIFMSIGDAFNIFFIMPKLFSECVVRLQRISKYHSRVRRVILETKRRNLERNVYKSVVLFYTMLWKKRCGITAMPNVQIPRHIKLDTKQDIMWSIFYHSPSLRTISTGFRRWLLEQIRLEIKLPGEKFYSGSNYSSNLYYLKQGIVQFISSDDSVTPLISVTSGTILGDISFYVPPLNRQAIVRCYSYCEVFVITRASILHGLHKFPEDRQFILKSAKDRIAHARALHVNKNRAIGVDRTDVEDMFWLKYRWWEISKVIEHWKKSAQKRGVFTKCEIPPESQPYHCPRYIGQLVMCSESQLQLNSLFAKSKFPWILLPNTSFDEMWNEFIVWTLITVLIIYPPNIIKTNQEPWFQHYQFFVDLIFITDLCISLSTSVELEDNRNTTFIGTVVARCKSIYFFLDVLSCPWIENILKVIGQGEYYQISHFNRMIKLYMIFKICFRNTNWNWRTEPMTKVVYQLVLVQFIVVYVGGYFFYMVCDLTPNLSISGFFGKICPSNDTICETQLNSSADIIIGFLIQMRFKFWFLNSQLEMFITIIFNLIWYIIKIYSQSRFIASLYLKYQQESEYYYFISHLKKHFDRHKIHPDLMKRLDRYLVCHRKFFHGMDILQTHVLHDEPYDIYWKYHGATAERVIGESRAFAGASHALVKELAAHAKFLIMPQLSTLILFGMYSKQATWIANGTMKSEYHGDDGELIQFYTSSKEMLSPGAVFLGNATLKTYTCATECEILFIPIRDFMAIIKRHPSEWSYIETCITEFTPIFDELLMKHVQRHRDYQKKLREKIFHDRKSIFMIGKSGESSTFSLNVKNSILSKKKIQKFFKSIFGSPETPYVRYWLFFRMVTVILTIMNLILQMTAAAESRPQLLWVSGFCLVVGVLDIIIKLFLPYYDENSGVIISSVRKVVPHYVSRGFALDVLGTMPFGNLLKHFANKAIADPQVIDFISVLVKFPQLYLVTGYFDYLCDTTMLNISYLKIIKWQIVMLLLLCGLSCILFQLCVKIVWDHSGRPTTMELAKTCWMPLYENFTNLTKSQIHYIFVRSLDLIQLASFTGMDLPVYYDVQTMNWVQIGVVCLIGAVVYWFIYCITKTMIVLSMKTTNVFHSNVEQLIYYLKDERVDQSVIEHTIEYFSYWWMRTNGINLNILMAERIGAVFRQDLNYYFYKTTLNALDTLLDGGENFLRQLCNIVQNGYCLPGQDIMREMDLLTKIFVVHRGKVEVSKNGRILAVIGKGGIFGQLLGSAPRPIRVSVRAQEHTDVLEIPLKAFQDTLTDEVKQTISSNIESAFDFMGMKKPVRESPYNTILFILRGEKTIQLPYFMPHPLPVSESIWYSRWLHFVWFWVTAVSVIISLGLNILEDSDIDKICIFLGLLDFIHIVNLIMEFWTMEMVAAGANCVYRYVGVRKFYDWRFYVDVLTLVLPLVGNILRQWEFHAARVLRFYMFYDFYMHFCQSFRARHKATWLKIIFVLMLLHTLTCLWIDVACRPYEDTPFVMPSYVFPDSVKKTIDGNEWILPSARPGGCPRLTKLEIRSDRLKLTYFVVARFYLIDYILAWTYITTLHTGTNIQAVVPVRLHEIYFKLFLAAFLQVVKLWFTSYVLIAVHTTFRELYHYDYRVSTFIKHLRFSGVSNTVLRYAAKYTRALWLRQRDKWIPSDLVDTAPLCLREDIYCALYIHHLRAPELFRQLPEYFLRQLVVRLKRVVIFPGNVIVKEGDVFSCCYFIHEGDVEKWYTDSNGESQLASVLTTNGYFGLLPALYPNTPYAFTYTSRTVVDLMTLTYDSWQDLIDSYSEIKKKLYETAKKYVPRKLNTPSPSNVRRPNEKSVNTPREMGVETDEHMNDKKVGTHSGLDKSVGTAPTTKEKDGGQLE